jgi:hypothetical protein
MSRKPTSKRTRPKPKAVLRLPDLDQAKAAVLNSLTSADAQRGYRHAIDEFVDWYCSEPRLSFNRAVVLRYRIHLESRRLAPGTINLRLGAVRRLAYEASDCGLLSPDLAAGIRRVKGVKKIGVIDHISWGIEPWDSAKVKAELEKRGLDPRPDMNGKFQSFHVHDPDGWDLQISNQTDTSQL